MGGIEGEYLMRSQAKSHHYLDFEVKPTTRKKEKVQRKQVCDARLSMPKSMRWQCECSEQKLKGSSCATSG